MTPDNSPDKRLIQVPLFAAFNLCAPRPIAVLTTMHDLNHNAFNLYFHKMPNLSYRVDIDYDAAPMSTLTLQGKRPKGHTGPFEKGGSPVHLVSITGTRKTYRNLLETQETVANFLSPTQENVERMYVLSDGRYSRGNEKIKASGFTLEDSQIVSVPRIAEAMAWIEYRLIRMIEIPESERPIFLLEPVAAYSLEGLVDPRTYAYNTGVVPIGHLSANICSGRTEKLFAKKMTGEREFTPQEHWAYSDGHKPDAT
jgi:flavin reductase (DIM6/NTAB) family NADH-FMN oxidoreductase RutF